MPSASRRSPHPPFSPERPPAASVNGNFAAAFSSTSTPNPAVDPRITGGTGRCAIVASGPELGSGPVSLHYLDVLRRFCYNGDAQAPGNSLGYQPSCGETVGIYAAAGNLRDSGNVIAKERTNIVLMPFCGQYQQGVGVLSSGVRSKAAKK